MRSSNPIVQNAMTVAKNAGGYIKNEKSQVLALASKVMKAYQMLEDVRGVMKHSLATFTPGVGFDYDKYDKTIGDVEKFARAISSLANGPEYVWDESKGKYVAS